METQTKSQDVISYQEKLLLTISNAIHARIGTKWDLIMVSASVPERVKEFLDNGFEPFAVTIQKVPKIDKQTKIELVNQYEDTNVIWMKRPEIIAPSPEEAQSGLNN